MAVDVVDAAFSIIPTSTKISAYSLFSRTVSTCTKSAKKQHFCYPQNQTAAEKCIFLQGSASAKHFH